MLIDVITIFPAMIEGPLAASLLGRAIGSGIVTVRVHDLRGFATDRHRSVDDEPFGGGPGMVIKPEPVFAAVEALDPDRGRVLAMSPAGRRLEQALVRELATEPHLTILCGRYEGFDERIVEGVPAEELSIGDYVLSGGELPAMVLIEAVSRQVPGVVKLGESVERDSFRQGLLDHPHYTRPPVVEGLAVPAVLLSGDHAAIERWREQEALRATVSKRPDLLARIERTELTREQRRLLAGLEAEAGSGRGEAGQEGPSGPESRVTPAESLAQPMLKRQ